LPAQVVTAIAVGLAINCNSDTVYKYGATLNWLIKFHLRTGVTHQLTPHM